MENNEPQHKSFKDRVLETIEAKNVTVRSRASFTLRLVALIAVALLVLAVSIFLCNFILFSLRVGGHVPLLNFGARGLLFFLWFFPWPLLFVDIALIILLEWLVRKFRFGYRRPALYVLLALLVITISVGFFVDRVIDINNALSDRAESHHLPAPFGDFYRSARHSALHRNDVCRCTITAIDGNVLQAVDGDMDDDLQVTIVVPPNAPELGFLKVGDTVLVAGDIASGTIHAFGIRVFPAIVSTSAAQ